MREIEYTENPCEICGHPVKMVESFIADNDSPHRHVNPVYDVPGARIPNIPMRAIHGSCLPEVK